ncbi:RNA-directed DNA polymerase [Plantactinospora sp. CA-290183]|uniref:RNA-directed DNA polymerase n=1 Tax=Plantactinospora sp. CA-290183 TaxID=3240006 RepID=UPI003D8D74D7
MKPGGADSILTHLDLAWSHVGASTGDLDLPDPIAFADMRLAWPQQRLLLAQKILEGDTKPADLELIDLPKNELLVRPLARVSLESRLMYEASVLAVVEEIDSRLSDAVFSHRWLHWDKRLYAPTGRWMKMLDEARVFHRKNPKLMLARTDVSAFYENVDVSLLLQELEKLSPPKWALDSLRIFLQAFNALNNVWGIPQGFDVTGILANLYLLPVDLALKQEGFKHFRYSDDMLIFGEDWLSLRKALLHLTSILRSRRLVLASAKTHVIPTGGILDELSDADKNAINYGIATGKAEVTDDIRRFFEGAVGGEFVDKRNFTYSLTKLASMKDNYAVEWTLENIGTVPHASREALAYLGAFHKAEAKYERLVADFLLNSKLSQYPFAQQNVLLYLIKHGVREPVARESAWQLIKDRNTQSFVREFAARYLGLRGEPTDSILLKKQFREERDIKVRRALLVACYEAKNCEPEMLDLISKSVPELRITADYLRTNPTSIPIPIAERRPYGRA